MISEQVNILRDDKPAAKKAVAVFIFLWVVTFILYLPAAEAGKIGDFYVEWVDRIRKHTFRDYMLKQWGDSLYYFILLVMWIYYKIFGLSAWAWHLLQLTVHVGSATFAYGIFHRLLYSSKVNNATFISFAAALFYCICPYNTEVIVHEHCFGYMPAYILMLAVLWCVQSFCYTAKAKFALWGFVLFLCSCFCIEIFYVTPLMAGSIAWYYCYVLHFDRKIFVKTLKYIIAPQLAVFVAYFVLLYKVTEHVFAHRVNEKVDSILNYFLSNTPKNLFHAVLLGRFFPQHTRTAVYNYFETKSGMYCFGAVLAITCLIAAIRFRKMSTDGKLIFMVFGWLLLFLFLICTSFFPYTSYITYDRYLYFLLLFLFLLLLLLLNRISRSAILIAISAVYALISAMLTVKMNNYWYHSSVIVNKLVKNFPVKNDGRIILLLNLPESYNGALMIGSKPMSFYDPFSAFKLLYNHEQPIKISDPVGDIASFNYVRSGDGAHVRVINDTVVNVTLNNKDNHWWQYYRAAQNTDNYFYKLNMVDTNSWYQLTLKRPASQYLLLYTVGDHWNTVDWSKRNIDQY